MKKLLIFTRYPNPGFVKKRLIPALGRQGAADIHRQMTEHLIKKVVPLKPHIDICIYHDSQDNAKVEKWLGGNYKYYRQCEKDLGERMSTAFRQSLTHGTPKVVLIGSDCPGITTDIINKAYEALDNHDLVIGPAHDGGYYLIGMKSLHP